MFVIMARRTVRNRRGLMLEGLNDYRMHALMAVTDGRPTTLAAMLIKIMKFSEAFRWDRTGIGIYELELNGEVMEFGAPCIYFLRSGGDGTWMEEWLEQGVEKSARLVREDCFPHLPI